MLNIRTMKMNRGDRIVTLDRSTLDSVLKTFTQCQHSIVVFDREWISERPYGRTAVSIPEGIHELRISRDLVGRPLWEEVYVNLIEKSGGYYILKIGPARFQPSKQRGLALDEFLQQWQELYPEQYDKFWEEGDEMQNIPIDDEYIIAWGEYLEKCSDKEPLSYNEWFQEEYEQKNIDRLFMTDSEKYGEED